MTLREGAKAAAHAIATVLVLPALLSFRIRALLMGADRALEGSTQALALIPGLTGQFLRRAFLARVLARCARTATIEFGTIFSAAGARIDEHAYIGPRCHLGLVHIERDVLVAAGVHIPSGGRIHGTADVSTPIREQRGARARVVIGAGSWIGSASVVMADVGRNCVIAAGAVVTKPIPPDVLAAGVPARVLRRRETPQ
jgi:acetyltransferase-like isoleucine patch superfamily enzyme